MNKVLVLAAMVKQAINPLYLINTILNIFYEAKGLVHCFFYAIIPDNGCMKVNIPICIKTLFYKEGFQELPVLKIFSSVYSFTSFLDNCFDHLTLPEIFAPGPLLLYSA